MLQTCVDTVKPGGTGTPARAISAKLAPLPPSVSRIDLSPSVLVPPNENTCFAMLVITLCLGSRPRRSAGSQERTQNRCYLIGRRLGPERLDRTPRGPRTREAKP